MATSPPLPQNAIEVFFSYAHEDEAVYDGAMESSFRPPPHQQLLKRQTVIGETLEHRR